MAFRFLPACGLALLSLVVIAASTFQPGPPGSPVAAFFSPFASSDSAVMRVAAAGGEILRHGASGSIVITRSDDPDFARRLYGTGALVVSAALGRWICGPSDTAS